MASASYAYLPESYEITIVEATGLRPYRVQKRKFSSTHFQINAGSLSWTTPRVQWQDNGIVRCNYTIVIPARSKKITFRLTRKMIIIGRAEINLREGLARSELRLNEDVVLSLRSLKDKEAGKLTIRITDVSITAPSNPMDFLEGIGANLTTPSPTSDADIASATGDATTSIVQSDLMGSLLEELRIDTTTGQEDIKALIRSRLQREAYIDYIPQALKDWYDDDEVNSLGDVEQCEVQLAYRCIALLEQELQENMCNLVLPLPVPENLSLSEGISYASKFWVEHVCSLTNVPDDLEEVVYHFLQIHLLHWMEALAIMKDHGVAIYSLSKLLHWTQNHSAESELDHFVHDAHRFAQYFSSTVDWHPLLIYTSAIPFTPHDTLIYKTFHRNTLPHVVSGLDLTWPPLRQLLYGHKNAVNAVAFSPDGSKIVSGSDDHTLRVWDAVTGQPVMPPLQGHEGEVYYVCFSPDGSKIASGSEDGTVRMWDAVTGQPAMPPLQGHDDWVCSVCFSPDGFKIASGSRDHTIRVWDAVTGQSAMLRLRGHEDAVWSVCFSPDGSEIVSGSRDNTVRVWDAVTGQLAMPPLHGHKEAVWSVCFSPDGSKIASGSADKTVQVWDAVTGQLAMSPLQGHKESVYSVCFSPDGSKIASGSYDNTVRVWDAVTGQPAMPPLQSHEGWVPSVCFSPDGSKIASGSQDNIRLWDAVTQPSTTPLPQGHQEEVKCASFSPDGFKIASGSQDGTVGMWDAFTGQAVFPLIQGHEEAVNSIVFSPDGSKFASGSEGGTLRVWDALTGQATIRLIQGHEEAVDAVAFSSDGSKIISGSNNSITVWDTITGQAVLSPLQGVKDYVYFVAHSLSAPRIVPESSAGVCKSVSVPDFAASMSLTGAIRDTLVRGDHAKAPVILGLYMNGYFIDTNSGRYLGKLPDEFTFSNPEFYQSSCIGWNKTPSGLHIPVIIHFPW